MVDANFIVQRAQKSVQHKSKSFKNSIELPQYLIFSIEQENIDIGIIKINDYGRTNNDNMSSAMENVSDHQKKP
jgi:hypothetical protein